MHFLVLVFVVPMLCIVDSQKNLSQNGTAAQKSTYKNRYHAKLAITGEPTNDWNSGSCATTAGNRIGEKSTWWRLAFPVNTVYFTDIHIWYRDITACRLARYYLYVSNTTSITDGYLCYHDEGPGVPSVNQTVDCNHLGRYVIIYNERKDGVNYPSCHDNYAWLELCDVQVYGCYKTWYGNDCEIRCSAKCISQHCYPGNGSCVWGCNCLNNNCDNATTCTDGCQKRFAGRYCNQYNIASDGTATQHPAPGYLQAKNAIDGDRTEKTCSKTSGSQAWWEVDTGGLSAIKTVYLSFKINGEASARDNSLYLTNTSGTWSNGIKLNMTTDFDIWFPYLTYNVYPVLFGRYLIYVPKQKSNGIAVVDICEVEIVGCPEKKFGQDCSYTCPDNCLGTCHPDNGICIFGCNDGWIGQVCSQRCSATHFGQHCQNTCYCANFPCDNVNGTCPSGGCQAGWEGTTCSTACRPGYSGKGCLETCGGCVDELCNRFTGVCNITGTCKPGWTGQKCDQACAFGTFGLQCASFCHCLNTNPPCNHITGECPAGGCQRGYSEYNCSTECSVGKFGFNCNKSCDGCLENACTTSNGICTDNSGCKPGWKTGHTQCNIMCDDGFYGDCLSMCHCREGICEKITGMCRNNQCATGWMGKTCSHECQSGRYSYNCENKCDTCNNTRCNRFNGTCLDGCIDGYMTSRCDIKVKQQIDDSSFPVAALGGGVAALLIVVCIAVIAVIYYRRRQPKDTTKQTYEHTQIAHKSEEHIYSNNDDNDEYSEIYINDDWSKDSDSIQMSVMTYQHVNVKQVTRPKEAAITIKKSAHEIEVKELQNIIDKKSKNNGAEFEDDFKNISEGRIHQSTKGNKQKTSDIVEFPYEHAKVILCGDTASGNINACFIGSYYHEKAYIATQAPMQNTIKEFWHMVWQENVDVIVMMTNLQEDRLSYWPESVTKPITVGCYKVHLVQEKTTTNNVHRMMKIFNKTEKNEKLVYHYQFNNRLNNGSLDKINLVAFYRMVKRKKTNGPIVVHSSTGVDRTGIFIALDALHEHGLKTGLVDPIGYVTLLRKAHMNLIQTKEQYVTIFEALLEIFTVADTSVDKDSFCRYADFKHSNRTEEISDRRRLEFQKLVDMKPSYGYDVFHAGKINASKNVSTNILPHDQFRPLMKSFECSRNDYINAVIIPSYKENRDYIVTQYPLKSTLVDFWTMIYDEGCTVVVLLKTVTATVPLWPKSGDILEFEKFSLFRTDESSLFSRNVIISRKKTNEKRTVSVISMDEWNRDDVPSSVKYMLNILSSVSYSIEHHPGSVAVVCQDGCRRSGVFVALSLIFEKMSMDDDIDIFQVIRTIQIRRPEFISTLKQYEYCYKCIKEYLDDSM